ncbi:DUF5677 domain-containing protein [Mucilaginibacter roseus]|uniref:DUF5677 domain-containing protein n=1 Tax=Mucilaginibacter roseus TaxID=1528868 RepID=A0ABS8TYB9_9SPHI|nr:DUF5677 domain-containing protein [Mucilaginibacter roseus]MCD8739372.1 DUF5677 domain-containing protein [Mucilaginibacter roseus]
MDQPFMIEKLIAKAIEEAKAEFKGTPEEFKAHYESKIPEMVKSAATVVLDEVFKYCIGNKSDLKNWERKIHRKIKKQYKFGLKLFTAFIELNNQISSSTYNKFYQQFEDYNDQLKLDTLIANHARACQIASEVRVLIANGFADGAHSRWRTLHEICVTFLFLYDHDYETVQMYCDYEIIEKWKKAKEYRATYEKLNAEPIEETDWLALDEERARLLAKYGKDFGDSYGWFINHMPKGRRNFKELEKIAGQDHFRAVYGWANENVHAGVSGIRDRLGLREQEQHFFF